MKFFIFTLFLFPHPQRKLFSLSHLVRVQRNPALPYNCLLFKSYYGLIFLIITIKGLDKISWSVSRTGFSLSQNFISLLSYKEL